MYSIKVLVVYSFVGNKLSFLEKNLQYKIMKKMFQCQHFLKRKLNDIKFFFPYFILKIILNLP